MLDGAERAVATSSGMAAVHAITLAYLKAGDHVVCSRAVFGSIISLFEKYAMKFGVDVTFVDLEDLAAWQQGRTGIPIVDAGMRQLLATGWMHNRVRMITAMFLSKNLLIDWRLGEAWFMQHLIDGDLAANNGGWQWCASTGMDAAPYFRIFNPVNQSQRFDPNGDYIREWVPELAHLDAKTIHEPYAKNPDLGLDYPKPIVDLKQSRVRAIEVFKQI